MAKPMLILSILILAAGGAFSACPAGYAEVFVPAVVDGQEGGLIKVGARIAEGSGTVFTSVSPSVGLSTQVSERIAALEGLSAAGVRLDECDVFFTIRDVGAPSVDGPSAGLAMAVAVRAAAEGKQVREDVAITGAIRPGGAAGDVGGIIDKAQGAARNGMSILITPSQQLYENIIVRSLSNRYDFTTVAARNLQAAYSVATSQKGEVFESGFSLSQAQMPENLTERALEGYELGFSKVAYKINGLLRERIADATGELAEYSGHFSAEADRNDRVNEAGYPYTAANFAFLSLVNADFLSTPPEALEVAPAANEVRTCLDGLRRPTLTEENAQWVMGADVRARWAKDKLAQIEADGEYSSSEDKYSAVRELYYAKSWCLAAGFLYSEAEGIGGSRIDEGIWEGRARLLVSSLESDLAETGFVDPETARHLANARNALEEGEWMAAIYDVAYASAMQRAYVSEMGEGGEYANATLPSSDYMSLWARLYGSQAEYLEQNGADSLESRRVGLLAMSLEREIGAMGEILDAARGGKNVIPIGRGSGGGSIADLAAASILIVALISISVEFVKPKGRGA